MKEIFDELEEKGEFIDMGYAGPSFFFVIRKDKYEEIKGKYCDTDWTGYEDYDEVDNKKTRKGFPYRKGRKGVKS